MPVYDFVNTETGEIREVWTSAPVATGEVRVFDGQAWVRKVCAPQRTSIAWSESAETNSPFYSHLTGGMVRSRRDEDKIAEAKGLVRMNHWDVIKADHAESQRRREEDELLATPLPDLNDIINADKILASEED